MKKYRDIITLPHHVSQTRTQMPAISRAAQFAPFAALTGYEDVIEETARTTAEKIELSEEMQEIVDLKLQMLVKSVCERPRERPEIKITYFVADELKSGGGYETAAGSVKRVDEIARTVVFTDGRSIPISDIYSIEGDIFRPIDDWL